MQLGLCSAAHVASPKLLKLGSATSHKIISAGCRAASGRLTTALLGRVLETLFLLLLIQPLEQRAEQLPGDNGQDDRPPVLIDHDQIIGDRRPITSVRRGLALVAPARPTRT